MDIRKLQRAIVDGLEDVKAQNIVVFNTEHLSPLFERVIIASGTSNRQTKALASSVRETVKKRGMDVMRTEGEDNGEWIIVDCGAAVAHIMQPAIREYYHLEEIWGGKAVKVKMGEKATGLVKASEPADGSAAAPKVAAKKAVRKITSSGGTVAAKAAPARSSAKAGPKTAVKAAAKAGPKTTTKTATKTAAAKAPARKAAATKTTSTGGVVRKTAVRKAPARKAPGRSSAPIQTVVVKPRAAAKRPAAKRPAAKTARKA